MDVLIVGASGNLGSHLVKHLSTGLNRLRLLLHERPLPYEIETSPDISVAYGDLDNPASLQAPTKDIDCIIYLAGVLFRPRPETFLHRTNTVYVQNNCRCGSCERGAEIHSRKLSPRRRDNDTR